MSYKISRLQIKKAKKLGLEILPSTNKNKKIDVYKNKILVARIGSMGYNDYQFYLKNYGKKYADERRRLYLLRHRNNIIKNKPGYYSANILW